MRAKVAILAHMATAAAMLGGSIAAAGPPPGLSSRDVKLARTMRTAHSGGTLNAGRNELKRQQRAHLAKLKGTGWKRTLRQMQQEHREKQRLERAA